MHPYIKPFIYSFPAFWLLNEFPITVEDIYIFQGILIKEPEVTNEGTAVVKYASFLGLVSRSQND